MGDHGEWACLDRNPYVGPRPFRRNEAFYGREREAAGLADMLLSSRIVLLHAPSGAGKTSLIQAAIVPQFEREQFQICARQTEFSPLRVNEPPPDFAVPNRYVYSLLLGLVGHLVADPAELAALTLPQALSMLTKEIDPPPDQLLVIDQLEEALTLNPADLDGQRELFRQIGQALHDDGRWALLSIREDYMGGLDPFLKLIPGRLRSTYRLDFLDRSAAMRAIKRPAESNGVTVDDDAAGKLADDLGESAVNGNGDPSTPRRVRYVEPVLLQAVCHRLWRKLCHTNGQFTAIGVADLERFGTVDDALSRYYEEVVREASDGDRNKEHILRDWIDHGLITEDGHRAQQRIAPRVADPDKAMKVLCDRYLIRRDADSGWRELYHDRLIVPVRQSNSRWRRKHLESWQIDAIKWRRHHEDPDYLLKRHDYSHAKRSLAQLGDRATELERRFVAASGLERTAPAKLQGRPRRSILPVLAASLVLNVVLVIWVGWLISR